MNNAISYAIERAERRIPTPLLQQTFISNLQHRTRVPVTVSSRILQLVIHKQVLPDINIVGGRTAMIRLDKCIVKERTPTFTVYHVPKDLTGGLSITSVQELSYGGAYGRIDSPLIGPGSTVGDAVQQQMDSLGGIPYTSEGRTQLVNDNTIMIEGTPDLGMTNSIRVILEHDSALSSLNARSLLDFAKLVTLAVKAYIYVNNVMTIDMGQMKAGAMLGTYKDLVDSFSDAQDEYDEYLTTHWAKVDKLNDYETRKRLIDLAVGRAM